MSNESRLAAIEDARQRRSPAGASRDVRIEWMIEKLEKGLEVPMRDRVRIACEHVRSTIVRNISIPVTKVVVNGKTRVTERSQPGEFPRADTTQLMKNIFTDLVERGRGSVSGYVGMPLDYGLFLETKMDRSFLARTLYEELDTVQRILGEPVTFVGAT
jgi:hypothetical protein